MSAKAGDQTFRVVCHLLARAGYTGLALLARRCKTIWLVVREGPSDRLALHLAAILASLLLGPILDASAGELFGIKTARAKLEKLPEGV